MNKKTILHTIATRIAKQILRLGRTGSPARADWESAWGGLRTVLLLLMLTIGAGMGWGQTPQYYVFTYNGHFLAHSGYNGDGSEMCGDIAFSPEKCLWEYTDEGEGQKYLKTFGGNYWLYYSKETDDESNNTYTLLLKNAKVGSGWQTAITDAGISNNLKPSESAGEVAYYVSYNNSLTTGWQLIQSADGIQKAIGSVVTITEVPASPILTIDCPSTIDGSGAKPTVTGSQSSKAYKNYYFDATNHFWYDDALHKQKPSTSDVDLTEHVINWSLAAADLTYASIDATTGEITVKKQDGEDHTLTLTCTATKGSQTLTKSEGITLKGGYYVLKVKDGTNYKYVQKSGNDLVRSDYFNADKGAFNNGSDQQWTIDEDGYLKDAEDNYLYWDTDDWAQTTTSNENCVKAYAITSIQNGKTTDVSGVINEDYGIITILGGYTFTATPYIRETNYSQYTITGETGSHYWYEGGDHASIETWGDIVLSDLTKTWTLGTGDDTYATISSSTVTISSLPASGLEKITLTCTISKDANTFKIKKELVLGEEETEITSLADITNVNGKYRLASNFSTTGTPSGGIGSSSTNPFKGTIDGGLVPIKGAWTKPLFDYIEDATIKNVIIEKVTISSGANVGAIAGTAQGASRIYNCGVLGDITKVVNEDKTVTYNYSSTIGGTGKVGSIVGSLEETSRVINCFSFAKITSGSERAGIVGNNAVGSTQNNIATMVMNCMFYGDIAEGGTIAPVYGGTNINNLNSGGLNTFNYYRYESNYSKKGWIKYVNDNNHKYNCALAVEERYLTRFEFYRQLLNSNKKLAAIYASVKDVEGLPDVTVDPKEMAKWVLETADRSIENPKPYPVLKHQGYYPSIINIDAEHAHAEAERNKGGFLGTLSVTISAPSGWSNAPFDAKLLDKNGNETASSITITLNRTDKDEDRFNFNYDKVQLPYYNDYGTKNYTSKKVVTGWKITSINGGTPGTYSAADQWGGYNFADRNCTNKDLYGTGGSNRVFSQGAYWDVPYGVTSITIEPYWGNAAYVADLYYDVVYDGKYNRQNVEQLGTQVESSTAFGGQTVKTSLKDALATIQTKGSNVYDNAIVLFGNFHQNHINMEPFNKSTPFTLMSVDLDNDHEPDYSLIYHDGDRRNICPIRFDFLNIPGTAQAQKPNGTATLLNAAVVVPQSWFEITNTCNIYFSQFEYEKSKKTAPAPIILLGGVYDQFTSTKDQHVQYTTYLHVGGNAWFKEFNNGTHSDGSNKTKHIPISVTGGDYDAFYLTGTFKPDAAVYTDNAECYISSGHFKEAAGAGQEKIDGNVQWQIYNADIDNFYGGGINSKNPIQGNITVDIFNSHVGIYCGGPKFGDMVSGKKVTTKAEGCVFGKYFGAGFGGTAISRVKYYDLQNTNFASWQTKFYTSTGTGDRGKYFDGSTTDASYDSNKDYGKKGLGVATDFDYEFFVWNNGGTGGRFYVKFASFSLAECHDVESNLTDCTINENFYGGGYLGAVTGTAKSVLDGCTVKGNVFGAGYSASLPPIQVRNAGFKLKENSTTDYMLPSFNKLSGMFEPGEFTETTEFTWKYVKDEDALGSSAVMTNGESRSDLTNHYVYTDTELKGLGAVNNSDLTITGGTVVEGNVYGGGEESNVNGNTNVSICAVQDANDQTVYTPVAGEPVISGNVFGGGKGVADSFTCSKAMVGDTEGDPNSGNEYIPESINKGTKVVIGNGTVNGSVYGGGEVGRVEWNTVVKIGLGNGGNEISAPTIAGNVFGAGKGVEQYGYAALVRGNTFVTIQGDAKVGQSVYGGGEIASVGKYEITKLADLSNSTFMAEHPGIEVGMPYSLANQGSGYCNVTIGGNAEIGPNNMKMTAEGGPDDFGHVFGAGRGILPYEDEDHFECKTHKDSEGHGLKHPGRMAPPEEGYPNGKWECYEGDEAKYLSFVETQALATQTYVTIKENAFVKGSVYGGSMNGHVQHDTQVTIAGGQIGNGEGVDRRYTTAEWNYESLPECAHWPFVSPYAPYDLYANESGYDALGGAVAATDGHTYYGNVFGGGSGVVPYRPGQWHRMAGSVGGNTRVDITGGHILTSVYGGNEQTDVGTYQKDSNGKLTTTLAEVNPGGKCIINMVGGTVGVPRTEAEMKAHAVTCYIFGAGKGDPRTMFNTWTNVRETEVNISGDARIFGSTFGGGEDGHVIEDVVTNIGGTVTIGTTDYSHTGVIIGTTGTSGADGNIFGGGRGFSATALTAGVVQGNVTVNISGGTMKGSVFGGGRLASVGTYLVPATDTDHYGKLLPETADDPETTDIDESKLHGNISVNISGGTIGATDDDGLVYSTSSIGEVFGGSKGSATSPLPFGLARNTTVTISETDPTNNPTVINNSVYGGGEAGDVMEDVRVSILGGTIERDVYGGGALAHTNIGNATDFGKETETVTNTSTYTTVVSLKGGKVRDVYGGALGDADTPAYVYGDTKVDLNGISTKSATPDAEGNDVYTGEVYKDNGNNIKGCIVDRIFGCNNVNGTPKGKSLVYVHATQSTGSYATVANKPAINTDPAAATAVYDVQAVYGGGNMAAYEPVLATSATEKEKAFTNVIIDGCHLTSIRQVYGGGNAASTPATKVTVNGTHEIFELFGGGNGFDKITHDGGATYEDNPGANVGFYDYSKDENKEWCDTKDKREDPYNTEFAKYIYGTGVASLNVFGGLVHRVFGGSNTKGNVRKTAVTLLEEGSACDFCVDEAYGGGKSAPMDAEAILHMACIPGLKVAYGGAQEADIQGKVTLNITNGRFNRVFGGNNLSGTIRGSITVNIEETGCKPIIIGELYGGGNQAGYSTYGYKEKTVTITGDDGQDKQIKKWVPLGEDENDLLPSSTPLYADPVVNIKSFTSIGEVYGGGLGGTATMVGSPHVNINVAMGDQTNHSVANIGENATTDDGLPIPSHMPGAIGAINNVYGGGNEAKVVGDTYVHIGTEEYVPITTNIVVDETDVSGYYVRSGAGTTASPYTYAHPAEADKIAKKNVVYYAPVIGADIRNNVYGGGNAAEVTGETHVVIGKETTD